MTNLVSRKADQIVIREAAVSDLAAINWIYNFWVGQSTASFDTREMAEAERWNWFNEHERQDLPVLVAEAKGQVVGWISLSYYHARCRDTVEASLYIHPQHRSRGTGKKLMAELMKRAEQNKYHSVIVLICTENLASLRLIRDFAFEKVGTIAEMGRKFDRWLDIAVFQKII
ncbi:MAG: GNAT family N-acetyltransferase [Candidatus Obscuribacterales bacterium]|nr:GNAT family N-acetyltransferase [Candidatus Obscuribacterales bacterium]